MGWFKRSRTEQGPKDEHLPFFTIEQAEDFRGLIGQVLAEHGLEVTIHPDHAVDDQGNAFGFWNIAHHCAGSPRSTWPEHLHDYVRRLVEVLEHDPFEGLTSEQAEESVHLRLHEPGSLGALEHIPHREFAPGIVEVLALDPPETTHFLDHDRAAELGGYEALRAAGVRNQMRLPGEGDEWEVATLAAGEDLSFQALLGDSNHIASTAVLLENRFAEITGEEPSPHGHLLCLPNRQQMAWHVVRDLSVLKLVRQMAHFARLGHDESATGISPHVYWWDGSGYQLLTAYDDGELQMLAGPRFRAMIDGLAAES